MRQKNLLIIHHGALGDVVVTFPVIIRLKKVYAQIDMLCQVKLGKLAQSLHVVDTFLPLETSAFASLFTDTLDQRVKSLLCSYEDVLLFSNSTQLDATISNTTGRSVYRIPPRPAATSSIHITDHVLSLLAPYDRFASIDTTSRSLLSPRNHPDRRDRQYDPLKVVLHPGSGSWKKCWPLTHFIKLAWLLSAKGNRVQFVLGPAEQAFDKMLREQGGLKSDIHKTDDLSRLTTILKTAGGYVGNDSGVSHLAAFLGLPTVVVFGPSDPMRWRPTGRSVRIMRSYLDCHPCFDDNHNRCEEMRCFESTTPEIVFTTLMEQISSDHVVNGRPGN
jgi:ADP-heptose:LPS heptosyltransferase